MVENSVRILVWSRSFPPPIDDGTAVFVKNICDELAQHGHIIRVVIPWRETSSDIDSERYRVVRCRRLPALSSLGFNVCLLFNVLRFRPDLVLLGHAESLSALNLLWLSKHFSIPYVILVHGSDLNYSVSRRLDEWAMVRLLRGARLLLANSRYTESRVKRREVGQNGTLVLHPGVDVEFFRPFDASSVLDRYGLRGKKVCLSTGRIAPRKGHARVLNALPRVLMQVPNLVYLIAGRGPEEENLKQLCRKLHLDEHVRFLGFVEQAYLPSLYNACDLFVLPSCTTETDVEGFGIVYAEAGACRKPVIGGRGGGVPEVVLDGWTGLLVDPMDIEELAAAMIRILTDKRLSRQLAANSRTRVESELSWRKVGEQLSTTLSEIARTSKPVKSTCS